MFVGLECLCPCFHASAFQAIAAADDRFESGNVPTFLARLLFSLCELSQGVGDLGAGFGSEAVVVEDEAF